MKNLNTRLINIIRAYKYSLLSLVFVIIEVCTLSLLKANSSIFVLSLSITELLLISVYYKECTKYNMVKNK